MSARISPREAMNRTRKARLIADVLVLHGATAKTAAVLPADGRRDAALLAGVRRPSDATWATVVALLESRANRRPAAAANVEALVG